MFFVNNLENNLVKCELNDLTISFITCIEISLFDIILMNHRHILNSILKRFYMMLERVINGFVKGSSIKIGEFTIRYYFASIDVENGILSKSMRFQMLLPKNL